MNKQQYEAWVIKADEKLQHSNLFKDSAHQEIYSSYNGYVAALGVSVLMTGLVPTLAIYYQDNEGVCRKNVLEVIAEMVGGDGYTAQQLLKDAVKHSLQERKKLQTKVVESSVALMQVIRTYKLVD